MLKDSPALRNLAPWVIAFIPTLWECSLVLGQTPLSYDHASHLFKAWHFWTEMLARGRLHGWSHFWSFGFPSDELIPCGSEAWVALFRALTLGQLSWLHTYALSFAGFLLFKGFAAFSFTRRFFGTGAAVVCTWIATLDPGEMLEGGWTWHTYWGVWPVSLGMSFAVMALLGCDRIACGGSRRDLLVTACWGTLALLTHQMALPLFALATPVLFVDLAARRDPLRLRDSLRALGALGLAFASSAYFLLPFFARSNVTQDLGWLGDPLDSMAKGFVTLQTFHNVWTAADALGLAGAVIALKRRRPGAIFVAGSALLLVLLATDPLVRCLHWERVLPGLIKLEANRLLLLAKLFWFPLSGYGAIELLRPLARWPSDARSRWALLAALATLTGIGWTLFPWKTFYDKQLHKTVVGEDQRRLWHAFEKLFTWTSQLRQSEPGNFRIAYDLWRGEHLSTLSPVFDRIPIFKIGYTPTQIFDAFPMTSEDEVLAAASVKYVVSASEEKRANFQLVQRFDELRVYRFSGYQPDPFTLLGEGKAELVEFSPERVRVHIQDATPGSRLRLDIARFERWNARYENESVPITSVPVYGPYYPWLMEVPAKDGELVLEYVYRPVDWAGLAVSWLALPAWLGGSLLERRRGMLRRLCTWAVARRKTLLAVTLFTALATCVGLTLGARSRARLLPASSLFRGSGSARSLTLDEQPCAEVAPLQFRCAEQSLRADVVAGAWGLHLCMTTESAGKLRLTTELELGSFIDVSYDPREKGEGAIRLSASGHALGNVITRPAYLRQQHLRFDTRTLTHQRMTVELIASGAALHCLDARIAP